ncbi:hypothetical protein LTS18_001016, partial [Coniosporium uncinatum]
ESRAKKEQEDFSQLKRKVNLLESDATKTAKDRFVKENEISSRLAELERTVNQENRSAEKLKRKNDTADVKVVSMRLELFERQRAEEVINSRAILEKIKSLEVATYQLRNEYLQLYDGLRLAKGHVVPEETAQTPGLPPGTPHVDSSSPAVQVPRTPLVEKQARSSRRPAEQRPTPASVPQQSSQVRRSARFTDAKHQDLAQSQLTQTPDPANSRRKRQALPTHGARQTGSAAQAAESQAEISSAQKRSQSNAVVTPENLEGHEVDAPVAEAFLPVEKSTTNMPPPKSLPNKKRKRREIPQLCDLPPLPLPTI